MNRKWLRRAGLFFLLYAGTYAVNSAAGGYWPMLDLSRPTDGMGEPEEILWQGRFGYFSSRWMTPLGAVYAPLILLDWKLAHPPRGFTKDDFEGWFYETGDLSRFHPDTREYLRLTRILRTKHKAMENDGLPPVYSTALRRMERLKAEPEFAPAEAESERLMKKSGWR